jgi:hypothetical protein
MKPALTRADDPQQSARDAKHSRRKVRTASVQGQTFEQLTPKQKDALLKELALRAGLIEDSADEE